LTTPRAEVGFHIGLALIVPVVSAPIVWALAIVNLLHPQRDAEQRKWSLRILFLAIVDTIAAAAVIAAMLYGVDPNPPSPRRLGVSLEETERGVRIAGVFEGSPAQTAGIRAGDVIVRANGRAIPSTAALQREVEREGDVELEITRGGEALTIRARPGPFVPDPERQRCPTVTSVAPSGWDFAPYAVFALMAGALAVIGWRRGVRQWTTWIPLVVILVAGSVCGALVTTYACAHEGAVRSSAIGLLTTEITMAALGIVWLALVQRRLPQVDDGRPRWSFWRTYPSAMLYAFGWMPRVAFLTAPLLLLSRELGAGEVSEELSSLLGARDPLTFALVTTSAVLLAPIAEETLFRGVLLPHLARSIGPFAAIYTSALLFGVLHVAHGVLFIGPLTLGAILGWARVRSGGLLTPIVLHVTFNGGATLLGFLS
jgi:membrane protease YdiL (CAAX protease family)